MPKFMQNFRISENLCILDKQNIDPYNLTYNNQQINIILVD